MVLNISSIENILFPLNKNVYNSIEEQLSKLSLKDIENIIKCFEFEKKAAYKEKLEGTQNVSEFPEFNIYVVFEKNEDLTISSIEKSKKYKIWTTELKYINKTRTYELPTSDLIIRFYHKGIEEDFVIPLAYILGYNEKRISKLGYYQVYQHNIVPKDVIELRNSFGRINTNENSFKYIGITKRNWKKRYQEHLNSSRNQSYLRFHRCLREEFFKIGAIEHIVDRAGITEDEAMLIEEKNVEQISLYPIFPKGLNMIPGGKAGLKFLHEHSKKIGYTINNEISADIFESELIKMEDFNLKQIMKGKNNNLRNEKLAELWATDINFRIKAITNQKHHFSYEQIQCARLLNASGWEMEKIFENIKKISNDKEININQLENLLIGNTYSSIPYVLL